MTAETRPCKNCGAPFLIEPDDVTFYEKIGVPEPTRCPECRFQRRLLFRNERRFYKRSCNLCKKQIIASYDENFKTPVYCQKCWWGDGWDPLEYGAPYDPAKSFFEQFKELFYRVPMISIMNDDGIASVNSQYSYDYAFSKNVYLCVCGWYMEHALYTYHTDYGKDVMDCMHSDHAELCYELIMSDNCSRCRYGQFLFDCRDCMFGYDLRNCSDCLFCVGLRNKKYCIWNEQYSKEGYKEKKKELRLDRRDVLEKYQQEFHAFTLKFPRRFAFLIKTTNCTGHVIRNGKNARNCFYANNIEDCRYIVVNDQMKDCYDCNNTGRPKRCYESVTPDDSYGNIATIFCWKNNVAEYSNNCHSCTSVLGCSGLKKKSYCILNTQYSKEEFESLRERIIEDMRTRGEWGEFFPPSMSPFAYNESGAQEWFPLTKEHAVAQGFLWREKKTAITRLPFPQRRSRKPSPRFTIVS